MPTYRIYYCVAGRQKDVLWSPESEETDMFELGSWLMRQEFPKRLYRIDKGIEVALRTHGVTDIRCPVPLEWSKNSNLDW